MEIKVKVIIREKFDRLETELINTSGEILTIDHLHKDAEGILDWITGFKEKQTIICKCKRSNINKLSGICEICWRELYPNERRDV